jgi:hypothetical protein
VLHLCVTPFAFLFGSGISQKAGFPSTRAITEAVLTAQRTGATGEREELSSGSGITGALPVLIQFASGRRTSHGQSCAKQLQSNRD